MGWIKIYLQINDILILQQKCVGDQQWSFCWLEYQCATPTSHVTLMWCRMQPLCIYMHSEDVSLLERGALFQRAFCLQALIECPHFRRCYVQASMELKPEDISLLERYPPMSLLVQRVLSCTGCSGIGTWRCVPTRRGVPYVLDQRVCLHLVFHCFSDCLTYSWWCHC